ncbi:uncharacterized protein N7459_005723 [Penicillium hispanicum]|uniref:uncharacterized protein n=1 Tax=Penicillium hispanicum TaxID=1080232 RepID=UPI00254197BC|nr:uncharacterized protein N7459_005723 [Penicillium hispanicum]KAJ5579738.1 hypothetical protein N7459_005723 [Penicillium hispanicum]
MSSYGCFHHVPGTTAASKEYLPQVGLDVHAAVLSSTSRTVLRQTFVNPSKREAISEIFYSFPLYDGASIVGFTCLTGNTETRGEVKPKKKADDAYKAAQSRGETTAIFDQSSDSTGIFKTRVGNVPAGGEVVIEITLVEDLKQDAQMNGTRYTVPVAIAPRYGDDKHVSSVIGSDLIKTSIVVDVAMEKGSMIRTIRSPSHPIDVNLGRVSSTPESMFEPHYASVNLRENVVISKDFVLIISSTNQDAPCAFLETHPTLPNQRALMISLIPKFGLPPEPAEIVFLIDRSGSMGDKIPTLRSALEVFLKSLPPGVPFNIVSFGSQHHSLWPRSKVYNEESLEEALQLTRSVEADMCGTEILPALQAVVENRYKDKSLQVLLLTDGEVYQQTEIFDFVTQASQGKSAPFFTLGIGDCVSHSLINGIARAGSGFSQTVLENEGLDKKVVRMLKGALMSHLEHPTLDLKVPLLHAEAFEDEPGAVDNRHVSIATDAKPISLFDENYQEVDQKQDLQRPQPKLSVPSLIQAPGLIPPSYPFFRSTIYVLFSQDGDSFPESITLRARSKHGPLALEIPVQDVGEGETIHQLAAKRIASELEEGHGWIHAAKDPQGVLVKHRWEGRIEEMVQTECERLGTRFQVAGQYCSFVAVPAVAAERDFSEVAPSCAIACAAVESDKGSPAEPDEDMGLGVFDDEHVPPPPKPVVQDTNASLQRLIQLQQFAGYWEWSAVVFNAISLEVPDVCDKLDRYLIRSPPYNPRVWKNWPWRTILATCLVGRYLETQESESQEVWGLLKEKADGWIVQYMQHMAPADQAVIRSLISVVESCV